VNKEKNAARERAIQIQECLQTSPNEREAFLQKKGKAARRRGFNRDGVTSEYLGLSLILQAPE
jgi:hypothetical protein